MSESNPPTRQAATLKELKAALPNSTPEFRENCIEQGMDLAEAQAAYIAHVDAAIKAKDAELKAQAAKPQPKTGTKPLGDSESEPVVSPREQLKAIADGFIAKGAPRNEAWARACRENPQLREQYVAEHNSKNGR